MDLCILKSDFRFHASYLELKMSNEFLFATYSILKFSKILFTLRTVFNRCILSSCHLVIFASCYPVLFSSVSLIAFKFVSLSIYQLVNLLACQLFSLRILELASLFDMMGYTT